MPPAGSRLKGTSVQSFAEPSLEMAPLMSAHISAHSPEFSHMVMLSSTGSGDMYSLTDRVSTKTDAFNCSISYTDLLDQWWALIEKILRKSAMISQSQEFPLLFFRCGSFINCFYSLETLANFMLGYYIVSIPIGCTLVKRLPLTMVCMATKSHCKECDYVPNQSFP